LARLLHLGGVLSMRLIDSVLPEAIALSDSRGDSKPTQAVPNAWATA
jgi:hypothetical protein